MESPENFYDALYTYAEGLSTALGYRDLLTRMHSERVYMLSHALGVRCGLSRPELARLRVASAFHDIGKIGIPDRILLKPERLDADERLVMRRHSEIGEGIMRAITMAGADHAALIIRHHHEHFDGNGYPDGLAGEAIPICARIISIADSYDAMAVTRAYHRARTHGEVMEILEDETGRKHDPVLMAYFRQVIEVSTQKAPG